MFSYIIVKFYSKLLLYNKDSQYIYNKKIYYAKYLLKFKKYFSKTLALYEPHYSTIFIIFVLLTIDSIFTSLRFKNYIFYE